MSIIPAGISGETPQYQISRSLRFNSADSAYLSRTPSVAGNRKTWTWSGWVKRSSILDNNRGMLLSGGFTYNGVDVTYFEFKDGNQIRIGSWNGTSEPFSLITSAVYRDPSSWYNIVVAFNSTESTSSNRVKLYVNGFIINQFSTQNYPSLNYDSGINSTQVHNMGRDANSNDLYYNGYMTEINFIDGQALTPSSFGETDPNTGVWKPKKYTGTYGTNGFYLNFKDNSGTTSTTLGKDYSGNGNNWTPNNFSVTAGVGNDSMVDTPTPYGTDTGIGGQVRGNYATLNPLNNPGGSTLSNGNLNVTTASSGNGRVVGTVAVSSGKWYWEVTPTNLATNCIIGIAASSEFTATWPGGTATSYGYIDANGNKYNNGSASAYGATYTTNDVIGIALDLDAGTLVFYKNGVSQGTAFSSLSGSFVPALSDGGTGTSIFTVNFGQRPFAYTAPSGFKALCTQNLPEPTIKKGADQFNTVLYTGTGSTRSVTGVGFGPGLTWIKSRSQLTDHALYDTVRGATKQLESNTTTAETTESTGLTSFGTDGFTVGSLAQLNTSGATYVGWNWKGGGTAVTNTQGTITSQVSANPSAGFSIVTYTGTGANATVGHGLGVVPKFIAVKKRIGTTGSGVSDWCNYHSNQNASPANGGMFFNLQNGFTTTSVYWNNTVPTSNVFSVGTSQYTNESTNTYVAYCFAEIPGYSAFGSYTGNNSTDGPFVYTGFRPAYLMIKNISGDGWWLLLDNRRPGYNPNKDILQANTTNIAIESQEVDMLSNGFKVRSDWSYINASTSIYIYAAFAENPFKYSLAR